MADSDSRSLVLEPIGFIRTPFTSKYDAPHQPGGRGNTSMGVITLLPHANFEQALEDLDGMEKIWLLYWFDRNANWKPKVQVPRGERTKRGLFATRSPHRPNPIGLSLVDLISVKGLEVHVANVDLLDGTPILDIKPYLPYLEAHPNAKAGWIDQAAKADAEPQFRVTWSDTAERQANFLNESGIGLKRYVEDILSRDPWPHPYRRTEAIGDEFMIAVRSWRCFYKVTESDVEILRIESGYAKANIPADAELHRQFHASFGPD